MANHTTPIDVVILANDGCYAMVSVVDSSVLGCVCVPGCVFMCVCRCAFVCLYMCVCSVVLMLCCTQVGQIHGGLMGVIQRSMVRSCPHVWFERSEMKDRHAVTSR